MKNHKGFIALDIDGTATNDLFSIPQRVHDYLKELFDKGWKIIFMTGRTFSFGHTTLKELNFPYYFGVQNGADILEMPHKKLVHRNYLNKEIIPAIEKVYAGYQEDFIIYMGYEKGDFCYYRPGRFSPTLLKYLQKIFSLASEPSQAVENFEMKELTTFPLIKCFGSKESMERLNQTLSTVSGLQATMIRDPISEALYLDLVTHQNATKGIALKQIMKTVNLAGPLIAAGDDWNDKSMFEVADVSIVMETAPQELLGSADIIAPSAVKEGIIQGLQEATKQWD